MRNLVLSHTFRKDSRKIPETIKIRATRVVDILMSDPLADELDINQIKGHSKKVFRVRIGNYRLIYSFTRKDLVLLRFKQRKDIYR